LLLDSFSAAAAIAATDFSRDAWLAGLSFFGKASFFAEACGAADPEDAAAAPWVVPDDSLPRLPASRWLRATVPDSAIVGRRTRSWRSWRWARCGLGFAALPCFLGDADPLLRRVGEPVAAMATELWLVTHDDLRRVGRVRAVLDGLAGSLARRRDRMEGRAA